MISVFNSKNDSFILRFIQVCFGLSYHVISLAVILIISDWFKSTNTNHICDKVYKL
jgi:hypothetical protein